VYVTSGQCILHNEDLHVKITVFCDVAPHSVLYVLTLWRNLLPPSSQDFYDLYSLPDIVK
jgi:hypothetical protein